MYAVPTANITTVSVATATARSTAVANSTIEVYGRYSAVVVKFSFRLRSCHSSVNNFNWNNDRLREWKTVLIELKITIRFTNAVAVIQFSDNLKIVSLFLLPTFQK